MQKLKLFYKKPVVKNDGKETFEKTRYKVRTEELSKAIKEGIRQISESQNNSITRRMGVGYVLDEDFLKIRKEVGINPLIKNGSPNDYVYVFREDEVPYMVLRPVSCRQKDIILFEEHEEKEREKEKKRQEDINTNLHNRLHGTGSRKS